MTGFETLSNVMLAMFIPLNILVSLTLVLAERTVDQIAKADAKGSRATFSQHCNMAQMAVCG